MPYDPEKIKHIETKHGVNGDQAKALFELAKKAEHTIVEIGSLHGRSTAILALGSKAGNNVKVVAIDPFTAHGGSVEKFKDNIEKAGVSDLVEIQATKSDKAKIPEKIGLLFIDGAHTYEWVKHDFKRFEPNVALNGWIAMHDFHFPGVKRVFDEIIYPALWKGTKGKENKLGNFKLVHSLIIMQKCPRS